MVLNAAALNRKIQVLRVEAVGGTRRLVKFGLPISARRLDLKDAERMNGGAWLNKLVSRFVVRETPFAKSIKRTDRIRHEGRDFEIEGIKELSTDRRFLELTVVSTGDQ